MKLFGRPIKAPSVFTSDRYAVAQVALYIFALATGVTAVFQVIGAFEASVQVPAGGHRLLIFGVPAIQNICWTIGIVYLLHKLEADPSGVVWYLCVGIMSMQIGVAIIQLLAQINLISVMALALAILGLGSLLVGRDRALDERLNRYRG